jgi:predicted GTPase
MMAFLLRKPSMHDSPSSARSAGAAASEVRIAVSGRDAAILQYAPLVKYPKNVGVTQLRYLDNRLRETFGFDGTPIRWVTKSTQRERPAYLDKE